MDETCTVVTRSENGESAEAFSSTGDGTELKEGICKGTLKTGGIVEDEMYICKAVGIMDLGKLVAY